MAMTLGTLAIVVCLGGLCLEAIALAAIAFNPIRRRILASPLEIAGLGLYVWIFGLMILFISRYLAGN